MPLPSRTCAVALAAMLALTAAHAQNRSSRPGVSSTPQARPAATAQSPAARSTQGMPNPAGLSSPFPAGISSGSGAAVANDPVAANNPAAGGINTAPGNGGFNTGPTTGVNIVPGTVDTMTGGLPNTAVLGAGGARGPSQYTGSGGSGFTALDIARSFFNADGNKDGDLSRGEASRLSLSMMTFEEMDRNFDGQISRSEYEDSLR